MFSRKLWTLRAAAFLGLLFMSSLSAKADDKSDALAFSEAMAKANMKLHDAGFNFGKSIGPALNGGAKEIADAENSLKETSKILAGVQADMKALKVPNLPLAKEFYDAHQAFLKGQEAMIKNDFAKVIAVVKDPTLKPADKMTQIQKIVADVVKAENVDLAKLQKAQKDFADKHGIILK